MEEIVFGIFIAVTIMVALIYAVIGIVFIIAVIRERVSERKIKHVVTETEDIPCLRLSIEINCRALAKEEARACFTEFSAPNYSEANCDRSQVNEL